MDRHKVLSLAAITSFGVAVSDGNVRKLRGPTYVAVIADELAF
jgi:hypothetical protein